MVQLSPIFTNIQFQLPIMVSLIRIKLKVGQCIHYRLIVSLLLRVLPVQSYYVVPFTPNVPTSIGILVYNEHKKKIKIVLVNGRQT